MVEKNKIKEAKKQLLRQLNIPANLYPSILRSKNFMETLKNKASVICIDVRKYMRACKGCENTKIVCSGGQMIPIFQNRLILHQRSNHKIGALGGASDLLFVNPGIEVDVNEKEFFQNLLKWEKEHGEITKVLEPAILTAIREIKEEAGISIFEKDSIQYLCTKSDLIHYKKYPSVYGQSVFYVLNCSEQRFHDLISEIGLWKTKKENNSEGTPIVLTIEELMKRKTEWFSNAEVVYNKINEYMESIA